MTTTRTGVVALAVFLVGAALVPDVAQAATKKAPAAEEQLDDAEDEGLMGWVYAVNEWYPIILDPSLEPEVEEKVIWLWLTTVACGPFCGPLWIPMVVVGEDPGPEYFVKEALFAIVIEWLTYFVGGVTTSAAGLGSIIIMANLFYLAPVSLINGYDRALKMNRARGGSENADDEKSPEKKKKSNDKTKKDKSAHGVLGRPHVAAYATSTPAMVY